MTLAKQLVMQIGNMPALYMSGESDPFNGRKEREVHPFLLVERHFQGLFFLPPAGINMFSAASSQLRCWLRGLHNVIT